MTTRSRKNSGLRSKRGKLALAGIVVTATVGTLAATAEAAPNTVWDQLAGCESSNNWAADTGNGFQGGLQFTPSTWQEFGGTAYAPSANQATREQQIAVAQNVQAAQGWTAWPTCSQKLGINGTPPSSPNPPINALPPLPEPSTTDVAAKTVDLATTVTSQAAPDLAGTAAQASTQVVSTAAQQGLIGQLSSLLSQIQPLITSVAGHFFGS